MSPPLIDQGPSQNIGNDQWAEGPEQVDSWITNQHITGLAISTGGSCGEPNYIQQGHCTVCGKSFATIQEEITLGYLEQTHIPEETYAQRIRRRNAFLAGMRAGSVILVPGGVSQTAACDGILYQISAGNNVSNPTQECYRSNQESLSDLRSTNTTYDKKDANYTIEDRRSICLQ